MTEPAQLRVVRTRRVRAIDERYYGRVARTIYIGVVDQPGDAKTPVCINGLSVAADHPTLPDGESVP